MSSEDTTTEPDLETEAPPDYSANRSLVESLSDLLLDQYPHQLEHPRAMSLRAQFPICGMDGKAGDTGTLWPFLKGEGFEPHRESNGMQSALHGTDFSYSVSAGRGIIEIQIHPCTTLHELHDRLTQAVERLKPAAERWKKSVLAYGGQPNTPLTPECLTHKFHYFSLLRKIQEPYLYRGLQATNRFSVSCDRSELIDIVNWSDVLSPIVNTLSANTPIWSGEDGHYPSTRWQHQAKLSEEVVGDGRWQLVNHPYSGMDEWMFHLLHQPHLLLRDDEGWLNPGEGLFGAFLEKQIESGQQPIELWDSVLDHMDTLWTQSHPVLHSDAALPPALQEQTGVQLAETEQQGIPETLAMSALLLGCLEEREALYQWWEDLVPDPPAKREFGLWPHQILERNLKYRKDIREPFSKYWARFMKQGTTYPEPFFGCFDGLLGHARTGLQKRGLGEEVYLTPLVERITQQHEPHRELRRAYILDGIEGFMKQITIS